MTEAERRAGERVALLRDAAALADASARLADRAGVAAAVYEAVITGRCVVVESYWRIRWTGPTYHLTLTVAGGGDPVVVEMFLPEGASELVLASSADGKMTINSGALAEWLGLQETVMPAGAWGERGGRWGQQEQLGGDLDLASAAAGPLKLSAAQGLERIVSRVRGH